MTRTPPFVVQKGFAYPRAVGDRWVWEVPLSLDARYQEDSTPPDEFSAVRGSRRGYVR